MAAILGIPKPRGCGPSGEAYHQALEGRLFSAASLAEHAMEAVTMLLELAPEWTTEIDRGPDWLFIRPRPPHQGDTGEIRLAEMIWQKLEQCFCYRVVLELDDVRMLRSWMVGELVRLHKRVTTQGGMLRLCGLSEANQEVLRTCRLDDRFPAYRNRTDAVMGYRPPQPR